MYSQRTALSEARTFEGYWAKIHASHGIRELLPQCERSELWRIFRKHLPRGRSLEAGCGVGHWVAFLRKHGYNVEGVEYREEAVRAALDFDSSLPIQVGDVRALDVPDESFDGYISLGLIEHFEDGPEEVLAEARRVTKGPASGGRLLISVPLLTPVTRKSTRIRELHEGVDPASEPPEEGRFFQFLFSPDEIRATLEKNGLKMIGIGYYDRFSTLSYLLPGTYERASHSGFSAWPAKAVGRALLDFAPSRWCAHMQMAVCVKA